MFFTKKVKNKRVHASVVTMLFTRKIKNKRAFISVVTMFFIGLVFLYLGEVIDTENRIILSLISNLGSVFLISGVLTALNETIIKEDMKDEIFNKFNLKRMMDQYGIEDVRSRRDELVHKNLFEITDKEIDIVQITGVRWFECNKQNIIDKLKKNRCVINLYVLDPNSVFYSSFRSVASSDDDISEEKFIRFMKSLREMVDYLDANVEGFNKELFNVYKYDNRPVYSLFRYDNKMVCVERQLVSKMEKEKSVTIMCWDNNEEENLFSVYKNDIEALANAKTTKRIDLYDDIFLKIEDNVIENTN